MPKQNSPPPTKGCIAYRVKEGIIFLYFFLQVHLSAGLLQPEQTASIISLPHFLHGEHSQV
jgi:hypothetical protein